MKVIKSIRLRKGNGCPSLTPKGIESAAAKDTTPRIPAQPAISGVFQPGLASATVIKLLMNFVKRAAPKVQINLVMINKMEMAKPYHIAVPKLISPSCCEIDGS